MSCAKFGFIFCIAFLIPCSCSLRQAFKDSSAYCHCFWHMTASNRKNGLFIPWTGSVCEPLLASYLVEQLQPIVFGGGQHTAPYRAIQLLFIQNFYHAITRLPKPFLIALRLCFVITRILSLHIILA